MSANAYGDDKGATSGGSTSGSASSSLQLQSAQAPRLRSAAGSYAVWKPDMDVYLERIGADGVHKRSLTGANWMKMSLQVQSWSDEALAMALASIGVDDGSSDDQAVVGSTRHVDRLCPVETVLDLAYNSLFVLLLSLCVCF